MPQPITSSATTLPPAGMAPAGLTTPQLAYATGVRPDSIRVHLCRRGHYYGLRPQRLPNGRLLWPADSLERLLAQGQKTSTPAPRKTQGAA